MLNQTLKTKVRATLAVISAICFLTPTSVSANNRKYVRDITRQLVRVAKAAGYHNLTSTHEPFINSLAHRRSNSIRIRLRAGKSYAIVGVCDRDCRDLDIALYDSAGNRIASDFKNDDTPFITINPNRSGTYRIRVNMARCNNNPCYYGVGAFGQ
ncbi:MAG: PPC domain-containing protein [Cyanobacteria bacterium P01_H01_bin.150]